MFDDDFKKMFNENCIVEVNGEKKLNTLGAIAIAFLVISIFQSFKKEVLDSNERKN